MCSYSVISVFWLYGLTLSALHKSIDVFSLTGLADVISDASEVGEFLKKENVPGVRVLHGGLNKFEREDVKLSICECVGISECILSIYFPFMNVFPSQ